MASLPLTARASIKAAITIETIFSVLAALLQARKILAGGFDPGKTEIVAGQAYTILSAKQAGELFGFGSQLHRMAIYHFLITGGQIPTTALALPAAAGGTAGEKTITFATDVTVAGTYIFRVGSYLTADLITINAAVDATPTDIAALLNAAINANENLPFTSTVLVGVVTVVAKTIDVTSDSLSVTVNTAGDESDDAPGAMTVVIVDSVVGAGKSVITSLWTYLSAETTAWITSIIQPYPDTADLDSASAAIGQPNDQSGLYDPRDYRPGSVYTTDTVAGEAGLAAAIVLGDARILYAANLRLEAPDYPELGYEIASYVSGAIEVASMNKTASAYTRLNLPELFGPLDPTEDWTTFLDGGKAYNNRDAAVKAGLTPIIFLDGVAKPGDVTGFWKPADNQNAPFKFQVNRWKAWNMQNIYNIFLNGEDQLDRPIVNSVAAVKQSEAAIDTDTIAAGLAQVTGVGENFAWLFEAAFTIRNTIVSISTTNPDRFDIIIPIVLSGNNRISLGEIQIDRDPSVISLTLVA